MTSRLILCPECATRVSRTAETCPKCGHRLRGRANTPGGILGAIVLGLVIFVLVGALITSC